MTASPSAPQELAFDPDIDVTVVVPSYNRLPSLLELLERLRAQDHPRFDILVVEQSTERPAEAVARLDAMVAAEPRIRVLRKPPLGVGGARNVGLREARGAVMLLIDDDDLPLSDDWISRHMDNYRDPLCVAVHGGEIKESMNAGGFEKRFPRLAYHMAMTYSPFGTPIALPGILRRKVGTQWLRGGNSSIRRAWAMDAGGWVDECRSALEEHDFSFRLRKKMKHGEHILFDPTARMLRRTNIPGGATRRDRRLDHEIESKMHYYFKVFARHRPAQVAVLLPFYPWIIFVQCIDWIFTDRAHEPRAARIRAFVGLTASYPFVFTASLARFLRSRGRDAAPTAPGEASTRPGARPGSR